MKLAHRKYDKSIECNLAKKAVLTAANILLIFTKILHLNVIKQIISLAMLIIYFVFFLNYLFYLYYLCVYLYTPLRAPCPVLGHINGLMLLTYLCKCMSSTPLKLYNIQIKVTG